MRYLTSKKSKIKKDVDLLDFFGKNIKQIIQILIQAIYKSIT